MAKIQKEERKVIVRHVMADGTVRDSIEGFVVPYGQCPEAYHILCRVIAKKAEREALARGELLQ